MNTSVLESLASASRERLIEMSVAAIERNMADPLLSDVSTARAWLRLLTSTPRPVTTG
ncbi:hypothetical protein [Schaalia odontolytica]|uniref:hypothetical protein n=1 Tax=Schaalia odontolytica TaxID=1660 RepID=UPI0028D5C5A4|nr:hypothetical protein [Schaalia odontolytica]